MIQSLNLIDSQLATAISWTIIHSLWQGSLIALIMSVLHSQAEGKAAAYRYNVSVLSLLSLFVISVGTFLYYYVSIPMSPETLTAIATGETTSITAAPLSAIQSIKAWCDVQSEVILMIWSMGVALFLIKLIFSYGYVQYLKSGTPNDTLNYSMTKIKSQLGITSTVTILESTKVSIPMVIGFVKPVILFPLGVVNMLTTEEVEGIIAHELAHIKRHDFIVNIVQTIMETLYYYHPAVWWISANIKAERENSCDDIAINLGMEPIAYAKALVKLQELQTHHTPSLAMALSSNHNQLLNRIKRIMNMQQTKNNIREKSIATILLMTVALLFSNEIISSDKIVETKNISAIELLPTSQNDINIQLPIANDIIVSEAMTPRFSKIVVDTIPRTKGSTRIETNTNGKRMLLEKEDGEITRLEINGKVIPKSEYDKYENLTDDVIIIDGGNGNTMRFFGGGHNFDFDELFDGKGMQEMMQRFEGFGEDFVMPEMRGFKMLQEPFLEMDEEKMKELELEMEELGEKLELDENQLLEIEKMMENFSGQFKSMNFDTIFNFDFDNGNEETMRFFLDGDREGNIFWNQDSFDGPTSGKVVDIIGAELNRDGLLEPYKQNKVELTGKYLKINGDKQPKNIWGKYKRLYEERTGLLMSKKARIDFEVEGKKSNRKIRSF